MKLYRKMSTVLNNVYISIVCLIKKNVHQRDQKNLSFFHQYFRFFLMLDSAIRILQKQECNQYFKMML